MKRTVLIYAITVLVASAVLVCAAIGFGVLTPPRAIDTSGSTLRYTTVIIDAGHGGEDGGTSSKSGLIEKNINLELALLLKEKLEAQGVSVVLTREDDRLLYDRNADYQGRKKKLDMEARLNTISNTENCILISLHMNAFSDPRYSGLQVWYSDNNPESQSLASGIQNTVAQNLQPQNNRKIKSAGTSIYLLKQSSCPAVLVECGFLSNIEEAKLFEDTSYKSSLCENICAGIVNFLSTPSQS